MEDCSPPTEQEVVVGEEEEDPLALSSTSTISNHPHQQHPHHEDNAPLHFTVVSSDSEDNGEEERFDVLLGGGGVVVPFGGGGGGREVGVLLQPKVPCPLCRRRRPHLTCTTCLTNGDFTVQSTRNYWNTTTAKESYSEIMAKFQSAQSSVDHLKSQCSIYTHKKGRIAEIVDQIEKCQSSILLQNQLKEVLKARIRRANKESEVYQTKAEEKVKMWPVFRKRLDNMQSQYFAKFNKLKKFHGEIQGQQAKLKEGTKCRIIQLRHHVFPIEEMSQNNRSGPKGIFGTGTDSWSDEEDDTVRSLMVAKSNYYSRPDELVSSFGSCYTITGPYGPTIPASGDYSAYNMWTEAGRSQNPSGSGGSSSSGNIYRNPAHCLAASLTYTTQFVNLIAYYLDLRLPHRLSYSEFTNGSLSNGKFARKVAKLNANIIHLCSSQGIHATSLQPRKTMANLLLLFDPEQAELGSRGPFEVASQLAKSMEDSIEKDLVIFPSQEETEETSSEAEDWVPSDWETINRAAVAEEWGVLEMAKAAAESPTANTSYFGQFGSSSIYRSGSANSLGSGGTNHGLLSSVTSFFRGWGKS